MVSENNSTTSPGFDIEKIARLARIALSEKEKIHFRAQLGSILSHFEQLEKINTSAIEPLTHPFVTENIWEPDIAWEPFSPETALLNAPETSDNQVVVPNPIE